MYHSENISIILGAWVMDSPWPWFLFQNRCIFWKKKKHTNTKFLLCDLNFIFIPPLASDTHLCQPTEERKSVSRDRTISSIVTEYPIKTINWAITQKLLDIFLRFLKRYLSFRFSTSKREAKLMKMFLFSCI